ncbi:hypothetical protein ABVT39_022766 [Epinephelus coioides]
MKSESPCEHFGHPRSLFTPSVPFSGHRTDCSYLAKLTGFSRTLIHLYAPVSPAFYRTPTHPDLSQHTFGVPARKFKIAELEQRISNLYWIRDEEARLDSVVAPGPGPPGNPADLDSTIPEFGPGSMDTGDPNPTGLAPAEWSASAPQFQADDPAATATSRPGSSAAAPHPPAEDPWLLLGAKPKWASSSATLATFTFSPNPRFRTNSSTPNREPWSTVHGKKRARSSPIHAPPCELQLENRYNILSVEEFPLLQTVHSPPVCPSTDSLPAVQGVVGSVSGPLFRSATSSSRCRIVKEAALRARRSSGLPCCEGSCEPLAIAEVVTSPHTPQTVPTEQRRSPPRPQPLFPPTTAIVDCGMSVFISGPLPTLGLGAERFSQLLQLQSWL